MANVVLVAGGWYGGWALTPMARRLRAVGHEVFTPTLTGLGERTHLASARPNLDTHILDVENVVVYEKLERVILCGHSYAGMVVSGVADRISERIAALVYADAFVPEDGESWWALAGDRYRAIAIDGSAADGFGVPPLPNRDPRCSPHPLAAFRQTIRLTGRWKEVRQKVFVYATGWQDTPFTSTYDRLKEDPEWTVRTLPSGHDVIAEMPTELLAIIQEVDGKIA